MDTEKAYQKGRDDQFKIDCDDDTDWYQEKMGHAIERIKELYKNIGYGEGYESKPELEEEFIALAFQSHAEAFFEGYDQAIKEVIKILSETLPPTK